MGKDTVKLAKMFKELGHPNRLSILRILIKKGKTGLAVGELQEILKIPNSTLSHHISCLKSAGIITQNRESRTLYCIVDVEVIKEITNFFVDGCCSEQ